MTLNFFETFSSPSFDQANVLITGAACGLGKELAKNFLVREKSNLYLVDKNEQALKELAEQLQALNVHGQNIATFHVDLADNKNIEALHAQLQDVPIDILINNAGIYYNGMFEHMNLSDFEQVMNIDLMSAVRMSKLFISNLEKSQHKILANISSLAGLIGAPGMCAYSSAKFALMGFSQSLAHEMAGRIHVCSICPSFVKTQLATHALQSPTASEVAAQALDKFIHSYGSNPEKVAQIIVKALKRKQSLTLINPEAFIFYYLNKFVPGISNPLITFIYQTLVKKGVVAK